MNQTNKEIIKATREFRDVMTADTAIIEIAKMLSTSADRLDVTTAALREMTKQRDAKDVIIQQLAAEGAQMLRLLIEISENHVEYFSEGEGYMYAGVPLDYVSEINMYVSRDVNAENPFVATDAALAEIRAQGVEMLAAFCSTANNGHEIHPDIEEIMLFAAELRKGAAV